MILKLMLLAAATAAAASAATATGVKAAEEVKKDLPADLLNEEKPQHRAACLDDPTAERYGMDYMYV